MHDLVIRNATLADGTGGAIRHGLDMAISDGHVTAMGRGVGGRGRREIDAGGHLVTPGFVDIHSHYDGQATWDPLLTPSSWHGVTTTVSGNCGVGFAPARPDQHQWLIELMEGVEDIPGAALAEGITWGWETFPEYLDALAAMPRAIDLGTHVPHGAVRAYVMGERGVRNEDPTADDLAEMAGIVTDAIRAGALGFSTSRTKLHRALDGTAVPGTFAGADELMTLGRAMAAGGFGVFEVASDLGMGGMEGRFGDDVHWMAELSVETGATVTYALIQADSAPDQWRELLDITASAASRGGNVVGMTAGRPAGLLLGLETSLHPFKMHPTYRRLEHMALTERVAEMARPEVKMAILGEASGFTGRFNHDIVHRFSKMYPLGAKPDYEPSPQDSIAARAQRAGRDPYDLCYDLLLERGGNALIFFPLNDFAQHTLDPIYERLNHHATVLSLADGGAHCRLICDASTPTFMLSYWARDRVKGPRLALEQAVRLQTSATASLYGLHDRGVLAPGYRADLNIIDFDRLGFDEPRLVRDLPADGPRLVQRSTGYVATVCAGEVTFEEGEHTGALPGRLIRGPQAGPGQHPSRP